MARLGFRMLVMAVVGAVCGLVLWAQAEYQPRLLGDPFGLDGLSVQACLLRGAGLGALLALVLDLAGLDLPLFPESSGVDSFLRPDPSEPAAFAAPLRAKLREWSSGSATGWIDREVAAQAVERLAHTRLRSEILLSAGLATLAGIGLTIFYAGTAGALGSPWAGAPFFAIGLACCVVVLVLGGAAWRVAAATFAVLIAAAAYLMLPF